MKPWPKLFHNLRSTRETELAEQYPLHVVTAWLGNSQLVAAKHYLQVTDDHFARAAAHVNSTPVKSTPSAAAADPPGELDEALQNALQQVPEMAGNASQGQLGGSAELPCTLVIATSCGILLDGQWAAQDSSPLPQPLKLPDLPTNRKSSALQIARFRNLRQVFLSLTS